MTAGPMTRTRPYFQAHASVDCPECRPTEEPDSATASMAAHAWAIVVLLVIFVLSSWLPLQPSTGPAVPAGVAEWVAR